MGEVRRALPVAPADWERLVDSAASAVDPETARRLRAALLPATTARREPWRLSPPLVFVRVRPEEVAAIGAAARRLARQLSPGRRTPAAPAATEALAVLVRDLALVHGLLDLDPGEDAEVLRHWGADGPLFTAPPAVAIAAHPRLAARVHALRHAQRMRFPTALAPGGRRAAGWTEDGAPRRIGRGASATERNPWRRRAASASPASR